jgi:8-oxo-dGTP diphosphatase
LPGPRPVPHVAAAFIRRGDEVVLVRQAAPGEESFWSVPGGALEDGELVHEGLAREVREETGLEIAGLRVAYIRQIDNRRAEQLHRSRGGHGVGYLVTVWVFEVQSWTGELEVRDPDGLVSEARFVPIAEAAGLLEQTHWLAPAAAYLRGELEPGSLHLERWHEDGTMESVSS